MVLKSNHCCQKNGQWKLGVATEPSPESPYRGALQYICAMGLDILKFEPTSLFYSASYFDLGGVLELCFGEAKPTKGPPWWLDCVANFSLLFNPIDSEKYWGYAICQACRRRYVKVSVHKHDRDQSDATHSSVYSASRQNLCWDYFAVIWTQSVEVVIWQAWYAETIGWDLGVYG